MSYCLKDVTETGEVYMVENQMYQRKYTTLERFQGLPRDSVDSALPYGTDCTLGQNL